jgi:protein TonB
VIKVIDNKAFVSVTDKPLTVEPVEIFTDKPVVVAPRPVDPAPAAVYNVMAVEKVPVFPGCESLSGNDKIRECMADQIAKIVRSKFNRDLASDLGLLGIQRIHVAFTVSESGSVKDIRVRSPHPRLDKEAERVIAFIPDMMPGKMGGKNVSVSYNLPIIFDIE